MEQRYKMLKQRCEIMEQVKALKLEDAFESANEDIDPIIEMAGQYLELKFESMNTHDLAEELGTDEHLSPNCENFYNEKGERLVKCHQEIDVYFPIEEMVDLLTDDIDEIIEQQLGPDIIGCCPSCRHFVRMSDVLK